MAALPANRSAVNGRRWPCFCAGLAVGALVVRVAWLAGDFRRLTDRALTEETAGQALTRVSFDVCDYLGHHDGRWPTNWDDLGRERASRQPGTEGMFAHDRETVAVDWDVDPRRLHDGHGPALVVWLRSDEDGRRTFATPNETIRSFLRDRPPATLPASRP